MKIKVVTQGIGKLGVDADAYPLLAFFNIALALARGNPLFVKNHYSDKVADRIRAMIQRQAVVDSLVEIGQDLESWLSDRGFVDERLSNALAAIEAEKGDK